MKKQKIYIIRVAKVLPAIFYTMVLFPNQANAQTVISSSGNNQHIVQNNNQSLRVEFEGNVTIGPDERSITAISEGGFIRIQQTKAEGSRELFAQNSGTGPKFEYKENGQTKPYETGGGREWLAAILPELTKTSTLGLQSRFNHLYKAGGAKAIINSIAELENDHLRAGYLKLLFDKGLNDVEVQSAASAIGQHLNSDHSKFELLQKYSQQFLSKPATMSQYLGAVNSISSDHHKVRLLKLALASPLADTQHKQILQLTNSLRSGHFKAEILKEVVRKGLSDVDSHFLLDTIIPSITPEHFRNEAIMVFLEGKQELDHESIGKLISSIATSRFNHQSSDMLVKLVQNQHLSAQNYERLFNVFGNFRSDHDKAELMKALLNSGKLDTNINLLIDKLTTINNDHSRTEVMEVVLKQEELSESHFIKLVNAAESINSDHFKAAFLMRACSIQKSEEVKDAIRKTAKTIKSSHFYGEVLKCLD